MTPFISLTDLSAYMRKTLEGTDLLAVASLDAACQAIRTYTNQDLNLVRHDVIAVDGSWRRDLLLPQLPVVEVHEVSVTYSDETTVLDVGDWYHTPSGLLFLLVSPYYWRAGFGNVEVDYTHGWAITEGDIEESDEPDAERMPSDLRMVALRIAANLYNSPPSTNVTQEALGSFSQSLTSEAAGMIQGPMETILDRYTIRKVAVA